jgi:hypothetical protein
LDTLEDGVEVLRGVPIDRIEAVGHLLLVVALQVTLEGLDVEFTA